MFSDNLTAALLQICEAWHLSYEAAAERCNISVRYFSDVIRKVSSPTLTVLEKFCNAFDMTPNDLLGFSSPESLRFLGSKQTAAVYCAHFSDHRVIYVVCPYYPQILSCLHQNYCSHCNHFLSWDPPTPEPMVSSSIPLEGDSLE